MGGSPNSGGGEVGSGGAPPSFCELDDAESCQNGGHCLPSAGESAQCECPPGVFGPNCDDYIIQATHHCLLGSDGLLRDCPSEFFGAGQSYERFQRVSTFYVSGAAKGAFEAYYLAAIDLNGKPLTTIDGNPTHSPNLLFHDILVQDGSMWGVQPNDSIVNWETYEASESAFGADVTDLVADWGMVCGIDTKGLLRCWQSDVDDRLNWVELEGPFSEQLRSLSGEPYLGDGRSGIWAVTQNGELRCPDDDVCHTLAHFGPFVQVEAYGSIACVLDEIGDAHCSNGAHFDGPFAWIALQGLETAQRFCGSRSENHAFECSSFLNETPTLPPEEKVLEVAINDSCIWVVDAAQQLSCYSRGIHSNSFPKLTSPPGSFDKLWGGPTTCARRSSPSSRTECWSSPANGEPEIYPVYYDDYHPRTGCGIGDHYFNCSSWSPDLSPVELSSGKDLCAVLSDGSLRCLWSISTNGHPRDNDTWQEITGHFVDIAGGNDFNCALREEGSVACWGANSTLMRSPEGRFQQIHCAQDSCCGVTSDSGVACWGKLHLGSPFAGRFKQVALWQSTLCAVRTDDTLLCRDDMLVP